MCIVVANQRTVDASCILYASASVHGICKYFLKRLFSNAYSQTSQKLNHKCDTPYVSAACICRTGTHTRSVMHKCVMCMCMYSDSQHDHMPVGNRTVMTRTCWVQLAPRRMAKTRNLHRPMPYRRVCCMLVDWSHVLLPCAIGSVTNRSAFLREDLTSLPAVLHLHMFIHAHNCTTGQRTYMYMPTTYTCTCT